MPAHRKSGFTLVELLVVIAIIAVLSVIGIVVFTGVQKGARDAKRRADINAISKSYEVKYHQTGSGSYGDLSPSANIDLFASKVFPQDPKEQNYSIIPNGPITDAKGFRVCATLEDNTTFCKSSIQGEAPAADAALTNEICPATAADLVGWWRFDGNFNAAKGTTAINIGSVNAQGPGKMGSNSASFDGNGHIQVPSPGNSTNYTLAAWVRPNDTQVRFISSAPNHTYELHLHPTYTRFIPTEPTYIDYQWNIPTSSWTHLAITLDGQKGKLYVNGTERAFNDNLSTPSPGGDILIGRRADGNYPFSGLIDEMRIYNKALTEEQVAVLPNCT